MLNTMYQTKISQRAKGRGRCEWCGRKGPTHSHHLFARRPDHPYLQCDINIAQLCPKCHMQETWEMQVGLSVRKIAKHGAEVIEQWAVNAPFKLPIDLPPHYWEAKEMEQLELEIQTGYLGPEISPNPMIKFHGPGPEGTTCGQCKYLEGWARSRTYWKCSRRGDLTHGAKTDQRKGWRSCSLFKVKDESD